MCGLILVLLFSLSQGKGEYGTEITKIARPLPLEYLIVELTTTTPRRPKPTLPGGRGTPFPIENRDQFGEIQVTNASLLDTWADSVYNVSVKYYL